MPSYTINTDALAGLKPYTASSTVQDVLENIVFQVAGVSYAQQFGSVDLNDALDDYLQSVKEGRSVPMGRKIRAHAVGLLAAGVSAPGGKMIACTQAAVDNLAALSALTSAQLTGITFAAIDGTRWPVTTPARATTLRNSMTARIAAVNGARDSALAAFAALTLDEKRAFSFGSIVWP